MWKQHKTIQAGRNSVSPRLCERKSIKRQDAEKIANAAVVQMDGWMDVE